MSPYQYFYSYQLILFESINLFVSVSTKCTAWLTRKLNIMDNMVKMLEKYAVNLEGIVEQRTQQLTDEKKKTDSLLYRMLPKSVTIVIISSPNYVLYYSLLKLVLKRRFYLIRVYLSYFKFYFITSRKAIIVISIITYTIHEMVKQFRFVFSTTKCQHNMLFIQNCCRSLKSR